MPKKQTKPKAARGLPRRGAAKRPRPGALRANLAFGLLTVFILAAGGASSAWAASRIVNPAGQRGSFAALPVYNVIGQRTDRLEFWPRARYHDLARSNGSQESFSPQLALDATGFQELLLNMLGSCAPVLSLSGREEANSEEVTCYTYYAGNIACRFYDDVPVVLLCDSTSEYPVYQGVLNVSTGRGSSADQLCYTALITPDESMTPATEEQYQQAYQTILEHLMLLVGDTSNTPYYTYGPLADVLYTFIDQFPNAAGAPDMPAWESSSEAAAPSVENTLNLFEQWFFIQADVENDISPWEKLGMAEPDRSKPEEVERFLQEYFRMVYLIDLQILRQDDCYLVLFQNDINVLGFYYDPLLKAYTGFGIQ